MTTGAASAVMGDSSSTRPRTSHATRSTGPVTATPRRERLERVRDHRRLRRHGRAFALRIDPVVAAARRDRACRPRAGRAPSGRPGCARRCRARRAAPSSARPPPRSFRRSGACGRRARPHARASARIRRPSRAGCGGRDTRGTPRVGSARRGSSRYRSTRCPSRTAQSTGDLQASVPEVQLGLTRAGVTGVQKAIRIRHDGHEKTFSADDLVHRRPRSRPEGRPHVALPGDLRRGDRRGRDRRGVPRRDARGAHRRAHRRAAARAPRRGAHRGAVPARAPHAGDAGCGRRRSRR